MNGNLFSLVGYLSVLLWLAVPLLWLLRKRSRWACPAALMLALVSLVFATINSKTHVNSIEAEAAAQSKGPSVTEDTKRKAMEESRGANVADIRYAEDGAGDFLDKAGMDEADLKYMDSLDGSTEPEWKKNKKQRSGATEGDGSLDAALGGDKAIDGVNTEALEIKQEKPPILMSEAHKMMADRLDGLNLTVIRVLILLAVLMLFVDYLCRANVYAQAIMPLPLPSSWLNSFSVIPSVVSRSTPRRDMTGELAWLAKRGDCFVLLTDDASSIPTTLPRLGKARRPVDVLRVDGISDEFVFEALWYGRSCFVVDSPERATRMFSRFIGLLEERKKVRAHVSQTAHLVWDMKRALTDEQLANFSRLAKSTGFSMLTSQNCKP